MKGYDIGPQALAAACAEVEPQPGAAALLRCVGGVYGGLAFRLAQTEKDWYRLGGVVTADGARIADGLEAWIETESGGDAIDLVARYDGSGYLATALLGKTHYLVADTGPGPLDFVQVEVEEVAEVIDRELFPAGLVPDTLEDLIDPLEPATVERRTIRPPRYVFRSAALMAERAGDLTGEFTGDPRFRRFLEDWEHGGAGQAARFCDHWAVRVVPFLNEDGDHVNQVRLRSPHGALVPHKNPPPPGSPALGELLRRLDAAAGYHMAWYFLMVTENFLPYETVCRLHRDLAAARGDVGYLSEREMAILAGWVEDPYHLHL